MKDERTSDEVKRLWRDQKTEEEIVTLDDIRKRAVKFHNRVRNRNLREYIASAVVIAAFAFVAWNMTGWMIRLGGVLTVIATIFTIWQLHRRGRTRAVPDGATVAALLAFHREELVRQRDAVRTVWLWYLPPFLPGMVLMTLGRYFQLHAPGRTIAEDHVVILFASIVMALVFVIILVLNMWGAARLQNRIHELDRLRAE